MSSLKRQLQRVGERLEQSERADPVRAGPVLHPADDPALEPDQATASATSRNTKMPTALISTQPERVVGQQLRRVHRRLASVDARHLTRHSVLPARNDCHRRRRGRRAKVRARRRSRRSCAGSHTTPSGRSASSTGSVIAPRSVATVAACPSTTPEPVGGRGGQPRHRRSRRAGQVRLVVLQRAAVDQLPPAWPAAPGRRLGSRPVGAAHGRRLGAAAGRGAPEPGQVRRPRPRGSG